MHRVIFKTFFLSIMFTFLIVACGAEEAPAPQTPTPTAPVANNENTLTILALGDSLTAGFGVDPIGSYPAQLERKLQADGYDVTVTNSGISGETSSAALSRLDWVMSTEPDIVIVETGGNDALRGVDLAVTRDNIDQIVQGFTDSGTIVIVAGMQITSNLGDAYTSEFAAIFPTVAEAHDAILIPFFLEGVATDPDLNQPDFIHPTAEGYAVVVDHIYPFVEQAISEATP